MRVMKLFAFAFSLLLLSAGVSYAQVLYGAAYQGPDGLSTLYTINITTGAATPVGPIGFERCAGMAFDEVTETLFATCERPDGTDTEVLVNIDPNTGVGTDLDAISSCFVWQDMSFRNSDNVLFADGFNGGCTDLTLVMINTTTGAGTNVADVTGTSECCGNSLAFSQADTLYYLGSNPPIANLYTVNTVSGNANLITGINFPALLGSTPRMNAMDFNPNTGVLYVSIVIGGPAYGIPRQNFLGIVNINSGNLTVIGETVEGLDAIAFGPGQPVIASPIPTLSEWGLMAMALVLGLIGFMAIRRKRITA